MLPEEYTSQKPEGAPPFASLKGRFSRVLCEKWGSKWGFHVHPSKRGFHVHPSQTVDPDKT